VQRQAPPCSRGKHEGGRGARWEAEGAGGPRQIQQQPQRVDSTGSQAPAHLVTAAAGAAEAASCCCCFCCCCHLCTSLASRPSAPSPALCSKGQAGRQAKAQLRLTKCGQNATCWPADRNECIRNRIQEVMRLAVAASQACRWAGAVKHQCRAGSAQQRTSSSRQPSERGSDPEELRLARGMGSWPNMADRFASLQRGGRSRQMAALGAGEN
jgi:hypothetical protein